ncbi:hypothetical protein, partial [Streptobacillus moniliformis]|uniref:hypothetical protein n=1 Tax=Streptobacillus moniliformis TaxID=34105 RepID=UPI001E469184
MLLRFCQLYKNDEHIDIELAFSENDHLPKAIPLSPKAPDSLHITMAFLPQDFAIYYTPFFDFVLIFFDLVILVLLS